MNFLTFKTVRSYLILVLFLVVSVLVSRVSFAQGDIGIENIVCDPGKTSSMKTMDAESVSVEGTNALVLNHSTNKYLHMVSMGTVWPETMGCMNQIAGQMPAGSTRDGLLAQDCPDTDPVICEGVSGQWNADAGPYDPKKFANNRVSGSLLGYANVLTNTLKYEPVPVNMAYFFKDYAARIPIIGDQVVYAQTDYGHTLINKVLIIWKIFRNIAYALMSLVMLWVGFAIITKKRISAQAVVTVQYALPKIVIALVLIAFSYPIGALITSFAWTLWNSSNEIINSISTSTEFSEIAANEVTQQIGATIVVLTGVLVLLSGAGSALLLIVLAQLVILIMYLFVWFKALWLYIKMVMSTATAPLTFALYALPGNDELLEKWFKQMVAWGAGIFGMKMVMDLTQFFAWTMFADAFTAGGQSASGVRGALEVAQAAISGQMFVMWITPLLLVFGYATAAKVPNMIEDALLGPKRR